MFRRPFRFVVGAALFLVATGYLKAQGAYQDKPYWQEYSLKYYLDKPNVRLSSVACDRNGVIQVVSSEGLLRPADGQFLRAGTLRTDQTYRPLQSMAIHAVCSYDGQLTYLSQQAVLSNAWAGKVYTEHQLPQAQLFAGAPDFSFLIADGHTVQIVRDTKPLWTGTIPDDDVIGVCFQPVANQFWILTRKSVYTLTTQPYTLTRVFEGDGLTAFALTAKNQKLVIGTHDGYIEWDVVHRKPIGSIHQKLPWTDITALADIRGKLWFGSTKGAFSQRPDGRFDYYYGERWLPGNDVTAIAEGPKKSILILTTAGLGQLCFKQMTLHDKAQFYEDQVRSRHIRNGFNATLVRMEKGNLATGYLEDSDNDGLWTSMYLGGEIFRYAVTKDPDALQNCRESLDAMERLYTATGIPGFPARSFERVGIIDQLHDSKHWQHSPQRGWDWKATTSSDEVIGHVFAFGAMAELVDDKALQRRAITLIDTLMSHIVAHDWYLIDFDGKPTAWGRWNPTYVNNFPTNVGDRKLNSSNIIAMLQTAYHFTKKEKYKQKAFELMQKHGYLENLMRPMKQIGQAPNNADEHSKDMSESWNHSDDEMYFVGYWGLYRYALNDTLKTKYKQAILDHWQAERPEKDGAWNLFTALTGTKTFDLPEAIWYLQEHPLDLIDWAIANSHRKDVEPLADNFRKQTLKDVLPPDERPIQRHNGNMFALDREKGRSGTSEHSAGDIWLLPYWMGRYLGVISAPVNLNAQSAQP